MKLDNSRWQDALDWQIRLWRWSQQPVARAFLSVFPVAEVITKHDGRDGGDALAKVLQATMEKGDPWWVSPDVAALVAEAAEDMPHDPLVQEDVPAPFGFALLGGPALMYPALDHGQMSGKKLALRAVVWATVWSNDPKNPDRDPVPSLLVYHLAHDDDLDDFTDQLLAVKAKAHLEPWMDMTPTGISPISFGDTSMYDADIIDYSGDVRWTMAFFRFVQQRVIGEHRETWGRGQRRAADRLGFPRRPDDPYVTAIRLRRVSRPADADRVPGGTGRHLETRHVRSGFWRRQWYPSLKLHRPIYINATVVGPEGAPLRLRKARGVIVNR